MNTLYNIFILLYKAGIKAAALFNPKAAQWIKGREGQFRRMQTAVKEFDEFIWFHCASLGEFEQGRPVMEAVRQAYPNLKILLTFFSPSGYEIRKNYKGADFVFYLPSDTPSHARKFIGIFKPKAAVFVKYEFWYNYINELYRQKIPLIMISAIFREGQPFFKPWGGWFAKQLQKITWFFIQDEHSAELLSKAGVYHYDIAGDTRFDRVSRILNEKKTIAGIEAFKKNRPLLVAGSTWPADEEIIKTVMEKFSDLRVILAPHEISPEHLNEIKRRFKDFNPLFYSAIDKNENPSEKNRLLVIDSMGMLAYLYRYAEIAYVGGGFGAGIHNLTEAAVYGIPVLFGPNHKKFKEATDLKEKGGGFTFSTTEQAADIVEKLLKDADYRANAGKAAQNYILKNRGATSKVMQKIKEYLMDSPVKPL